MVKKSVLSWYGGKSRLVNWLMGFHPAGVRTFVDVFGGSGVVCLNSPAPVRVYNDLNEEVVFLFRVMRERMPELKRVLQLTPYSRKEFAYCLEPVNEPLLDPAMVDVERARRIFVKYKMGFSGGGLITKWSGWSYDITGHARGMGKGVSRFRSSIDDLEDFVAELATWQIDCLGFDDLIPRYDSPATFYYCDPTYLQSVRSDKASRRYVHEMTVKNHIELAELLNGVKGMAMVSGYADPLYDDLFAGWDCHNKQVFVTATKGDRSPRMECVWLNPALVATLERERVEAERDVNVVDFGLFA